MARIFHGLVASEKHSTEHEYAQQANQPDGASVAARGTHGRYAPVGTGYRRRLGSRRMMSEQSRQFSPLDFRRLPFDLQCDETSFSGEDREKLRKYGSWMHALMQGFIAPTTPAQDAFVECCQGKRVAETEFEVLWKTYRLQVLFERVQRMEKSLVDGSREYAEVRREYARLARMGYAARAGVDGKRRPVGELPLCSGCAWRSYQSCVRPRFYECPRPAGTRVLWFEIRPGSGACRRT